MAKAGGSRGKGWMLILMVSILILSLEQLLVAAVDTSPVPAPTSGAPPPPGAGVPPSSPPTSRGGSTGKNGDNNGGGGSSGLSGGAKAGIAITVILGVVAIGGGFFIYRMRSQNLRRANISYAGHANL